MKTSHCSPFRHEMKIRKMKDGNNECWNRWATDSSTSSAFLAPTKYYMYIFFLLVCFIPDKVNQFQAPNLFHCFLFLPLLYWVVTLIRNHSFFSSNQFIHILCHRWLMIQLMLVCLPAIEMRGHSMVYWSGRRYWFSTILTCSRLFLRINFMLNAHRSSIIHIWNSTSFSIWCKTSHT